MKKSLALFIGSRYTAFGTRRLLTGFISLLSITGLGLGVGILITVLSVMNGFNRELQDRILAMVPHITINTGRLDLLRSRDDWRALQGQLESVPGVAGSSPYLQVQGMLLANGFNKGVLVNGIDPAEEARVSIIDELIVDGSYAGLADGAYQILIGTDLAARLGVGVGDSVTLVSTVVPITPLGEFTRRKQVTVGGIFQVGSQLDSNLALAHIADVQRIYRLGNGIHGLRVQLDDLFGITGVSRDIRNTLTGDFTLSAWTRDYGNMYENIRISKTLVGLLLSLLVAVAAFNVVVSLVMVVKEKQGDIAILRTMGASLGSIRHIFLVQGFHIGLVGTGIGLGLGIALSLTVSDIVLGIEDLTGVRFLSADVYPVNYLPSQLELADLLLVCTLSLVLTLLATLYPAWSAARVNPAEILRYE